MSPLLPLLLLAVSARAAEPDSNLVILDGASKADSVRVIVADKATRDEYAELLDAVAPGRTVETIDDYAAHADPAAVLAVRARLTGRKAVVYRYRKAVNPVPAALRAPVAPAKPAPAKSADAMSSQQLYLEGVIYYQKGDYEKARERWKKSAQLDPGNGDAKAGLERIEKLYGPANP